MYQNGLAVHEKIKVNMDKTLISEVQAVICVLC